MNSNKVKSETRDKVLKAIKKLNYVPNTSAQMLAKKSNKVIGVISSLPISDPFYSYMDDCIGDECQKYGYGILYVVCHENENGCDKEISMLYGKVDAFVLLGEGKILPENVKKLVEMRMPVALFKSGIIMDGAISVDIDNRKSGELAANYLYRKGFRKIGYLHGDAKGEFSEGRERYDGFVKATSKLGLRLKKEFVGDRNYKVSYNLAERILESGLDALFCETDIMAYGICAALADKGIKIPDRLAILGFDDIKFRNFETTIHLSTVSQPIRRMAACIVGALVNRIENEVPYGKEQLFETKIVEGETT